MASKQSGTNGRSGTDEQLRREPPRIAAPESPASRTERQARRVQHDLAVHRARARARRAAVVGPCVTIAWLLLFSMGLTIPSSGYRARLLALQGPPAAAASGETGAAPAVSPPGFLESVGAIAMSTLTYTPTNLAALCCISALIGCFGRVATWPDGLATTTTTQATATVHSGATPKSNSEPGKPASETTLTVSSDTPVPSPAAVSDTALSSIGALAPAITAVMWGFFIYLAMISGMVAITGEPFGDTTPEQYLRLAGASSLFAFVVGWRPQVLAQLVAQVGPGKLR